MAGIRTELVFEQPSSCPVAAASADADGPVRNVTWAGQDGDPVTEQFTVDSADPLPEFDEVFDYGSHTVYEFDRDAGELCICEYIQQSLGPVTSIRARDGALHLTIHASEMDRLRDLMGELGSRFGDVSMKYLVQSREADDEPELVPVDLQRLTDRQREVLETAHAMGYFEYPRRANATEVAGELGIEPSTLAEHLAVAQSKLLEELVPTGD